MELLLQLFVLFDFMACDFMGEEDIERQKPNVERMQLLGAKIVQVSSGTRHLKMQ